tara:strand:- start:4497 stop:5324 length:828 start_codon:yes stop_codon:yes gene_type:complete
MLNLNNQQITEIEKLANELRISCLDMTNKAKSSHIGSAFSIAEIVAVLYGLILKYDIKNPDCLNRDRFILSKGHAGVCLYAALAKVGFFEKKLLQTYYQNGSNLSGHVSHKNVPGVDFSTGSLGQGLGIATGFALSSKMEDRKNMVFCLMSDGECDEGSTWEAALFAAHHKLDNLTAIIDFNKIQSLDYVKNTIGIEPLNKKWIAFNWHVIEVDGHCIKDLYDALILKSSKPKMIIAHTTKGKGVSFMEDSVLWHYRSAQDDEYLSAIKELKNKK